MGAGPTPPVPHPAIPAAVQVSPEAAVAVQFVAVGVALTGTGMNAKLRENRPLKINNLMEGVFMVLEVWLTCCSIILTILKLFTIRLDCKVTINDALIARI